MADLDERLEESSSSSSSSSQSQSQSVKSSSSSKTSSFFNRSLTMYASASEPRKALDHAGSFRKLYTSIETVRSAGSSFRGKVKKLCSFFETAPPPPQPPRNAAVSEPQSALLSKQHHLLRPSKSMAYAAPDFRILSIHLPGTDDRIVLYHTSLRGIRRTYEDCYAVRMIFRGFGVWVDERDISMDSEYRKELQSVLGAKNVTLPQVFIKGKYVGGADVIKQLFETGELARILQGIQSRKPGFVCEVCGDARFAPCLNCSGSRKVFDEDEGILKRCSECNENGLIRCPDCCF